MPGGTRIVPVECPGMTARIVPGSRPASLRADATDDALAVLGPTWTDGSPAQLLHLP